MIDIDWSKQPTPRHVALIDKVGDLHWVVKNDDGLGSSWYQCDSDINEGWCIKDIDVDYMIHEKPKEPEYMPKVGEWCEVRIVNSWIKVRFHGECERVGYYVFYTDTFEYREIKPADFRPIKSDRDVFIDRAREINRGLRIDASEQEMLKALYDNGARFTDE